MSNHFAFGIVDKNGKPYLKNYPVAEDRESLDSLVEYLNDIPQQPDSKYIQPFKVVELAWREREIAIRHVGYAIKDSDGDVYHLDHFDSKDKKESMIKNIQHLARHRDAVWPDFAPHKVVKVLIDDGVEG